MGKQNWNSVETKTKIKNTILSLYPDLNIANVDFDELISTHYDVVLSAIREVFIAEVMDEKKSWMINQVKDRTIDEQAERIYGIQNTDPTKPYATLSEKEKDYWKSQVQITDKLLSGCEKEVEQEIRRIANKTIDRIIDLEQNGQLKNYNAAQVIMNLTSSIPQTEYLSDELVAKWKERFGITDDVPDDALIDVYCFQCADKNNFMNYGGDIGPKNDKIFVLSKKDYEELVASELFDEHGRCLNIPKLSAILGNVNLGNNPMCIHYKVKKSDIQCSTGDLATAYFGEFCPPLSTQGGFYKENGQKIYVEGLPEAVVPSTTYLLEGQKNPYIEIISHSRDVSTEQLVAKADKMLLTNLTNSEQLEDSQTLDSQSNIGINNPSDDQAIVEKIAELEAQEETKVIAFARGQKIQQYPEIFDMENPNLGGIKHGL